MVGFLRYVFVDGGDVSNTGIKPYGVVLDPWPVREPLGAPRDLGVVSAGAIRL